jgi:leucyl/phenylalanyl-tRNA--protein transferase
MPVYRLSSALLFPPPEGASPEGIVAVGGDLSPERLVLAYGQGIFPWPHDGLPMLWFSPDPRYVIVPESMHVPRSLRKQIRRREYEVRMDTAFDAVIAGCAETRRPGQAGTWITAEMRTAYRRLFELGFAHSVEAFRDGLLVGGLYGVSLGAAFFGESMFASAPDASKVAFALLLEQLFERWGFHFVDAQVETEHLLRFGARPIARRAYLERLALAMTAPTRRGPWKFSA